MTLKRRGVAGVVFVAAAALAAGVAVASIPGPTGAIDGCYVSAGPGVLGQLRVIDVGAGNTCDAVNETALKWSQAGPQGPQGPKGDPGAGVTAFRTSLNQRRTFVDEPPGDARQDHLDVKLQLPAGSYAVFGKWVGGSEGMICFVMLHNGTGAMEGSIYGALSQDPNLVAYDSDLGVPVTRYSTESVHGDASTVGQITQAGYALVRCELPESHPATAQTPLQASLTALQVARAIVGDDNGGTNTPPSNPPKVTVKKALLPSATVGLSTSTENQLLRIASPTRNVLTRRQRAQIVLLSSSGHSVAEIAIATQASALQVRRVVGDFSRRGIKAIR